MLMYIITLIPKVLNSHHLDEFRHITLLGFLALVKVIDFSNCKESAFIKERFIVDGAVVINNVVSLAKGTKYESASF